MVVKIDDFDYKNDFKKVNIGIAERFLRFSKEFDIKCNKEVVNAFVQGLEGKMLADFQQLIGIPHNDVYNAEVLDRIKKKLEEIEHENIDSQEKELRKTQYLALKRDTDFNLRNARNNEYTYLSNINYYMQLISYLNKLADGVEKPD